MNRRSFISSILAAGAAPAIVRAESLMKLGKCGLLVPYSAILTYSSFISPTATKIIDAVDIYQSDYGDYPTPDIYPSYCTDIGELQRWKQSIDPAVLKAHQEWLNWWRGAKQ